MPKKLVSKGDRMRAEIWAFEGTHEVTSLELLVLLYLIVLTGEKKRCYPKIKTIARMTRLSVRSVERIIPSLKEKGLIDIQHQFDEGKQKHSYYTVLWKFIEGRTEKTHGLKAFGTD